MRAHLACLAALSTGPMIRHKAASSSIAAPPQPGRARLGRRRVSPHRPASLRRAIPSCADATKAPSPFSQVLPCCRPPQAQGPVSCKGTLFSGSAAGTSREEPTVWRSSPAAATLSRTAHHRAHALRSPLGRSDGRSLVPPGAPAEGALLRLCLGTPSESRKLPDAESPSGRGKWLAR